MGWRSPGRAQAIENHTGDGSVASFTLWWWRWDWVVEQRCSLTFWSWAYLVLTWSCIWSRVGLEYPVKQQLERGEAFIGRTYCKKILKTKIPKWGFKTGEFLSCAGQAKLCFREHKEEYKKSSTGFRQKLLTLLAAWHLCKILLKGNIIKLSILSTSFGAFSPPPHQIEMTSFEVVLVWNVTKSRFLATNLALCPVWCFVPPGLEYLM